MGDRESSSSTRAEARNLRPAVPNRKREQWHVFFRRNAELAKFGKTVQLKPLNFFLATFGRKQSRSALREAIEKLGGLPRSVAETSDTAKT